MRMIVLWLPAALLLLTACERQPPYEPVVDTLLLMQAVVDPQADVLWGSVGSIMTEEGTEDFFPRTEAEWAEVRNATVLIMEAGNLLMMGERAIDDGPWMELSKGMIDAGKLAFEAAESKNPDAIFDIGGVVYAACNDCHERYWVGDKERYPGDNAPEGPAE